MDRFVNFLNDLIWSPALIVLCLGAGLYFSVRTRFLQVRHVRDMFKLLFRSEASARGISSYQAFALAISGRVGIGNIAGVATAIAMGGPGAIFWMWAIAFLGAGSAFVEATLAQIYKEEINGQYRGGPAYYIERGLKVKWYAVVFAVSTTVATGFFMPGVQSNAIGEAMRNAFGLPLLASAMIVAGLIALIIFGGVKRISRAAEAFVPIMAVGYVGMAVVVVALHWREVPAIFALIFRSAFGADAAFGGVVGLAISWGVKRGIYSNEAGQGSTPMAAAAAEVKHPAVQGLVQAFSVYVDTWLVCSSTAFMVLLTGKYNVVNPAGGFLREGLPGETAGPGYTQAAVDTVVSGFGSAFVAVALFFFAFTTLMAYYYYAETNLAYLRRSKSSPKLFLALRLVFVGVTFYGTLRHADVAWAMGDVGVGLMAWLNLIAILLLAKPAIACLRDYEAQRRAGVAEPSYIAKTAGVDNAELWRD
ncbi:alanine/glycine:cation symporter family protein [Opitutus terrae]|uniref:Amino acid carrier protein n=1 Tax=Opitutus terrae (strain DSM 11246 / JCM 15787 / PB90-1) TaxID=452637 RepID=B1ZTG5_OPITP|nr:alanine/glycine:cation symporter family protein [Opitutus terrae]ACB73910.1 amino acid carrier protein [Opitutus terrae PB90-1]